MTTSVLVIDDDAEFRALAIRLLTDMGLDVVGEAGSVAGATATAAALRPDSALVDISLPDGDGLSLAADLAALPWRPRVVLTSTDPEAASDPPGPAPFVAKDALLDGRLRGLLTGREYG